MSRSLRSLVVAVLSALLATTTLAAPAQADPDWLELSIDSETPLFSNTETYAPGVHTRSFILSNKSPSKTLATIELVRPAQGQGALAPFLGFFATMDGKPTTPSWTALSGEPQDCLLIGSAYLSPRSNANVVVMMRMEASGQAGMDKSAQFAFRVTLSQVTNKNKVDPCGSKSSGAAVQVLGSQARAASFSPTATDPQRVSEPLRSADAVLLVAAALLASGGGLLLAVRRRRRTA